VVLTLSSFAHLTRQALWFSIVCQAHGLHASSLLLVRRSFEWAQWGEIQWGSHLAYWAERGRACCAICCPSQVDGGGRYVSLMLDRLIGRRGNIASIASDGEFSKGDLLSKADTYPHKLHIREGAGLGLLVVLRMNLRSLNQISARRRMRSWHSRRIGRL
jgi:hypothetical protein